jgi:sensor histidine kinase regulating citrate/malate metabolism
MKNPFGKLRASKLSTKIILLVEIISILSGSVFCVVSITNSRLGIKKSIQQRMLDIANCAAGSINGDILGALKAEDADTPEYRQIYNTLDVFCKNVELEYVYAIRDEGNGKFTFTVDPDPVDPGEFGEEVKYTEALAAAARGTAALDETPYTDAWGTFYSAYSPVRDSSGRIAGIIAADFSSQWFEAQLSQRTGTTILSSVAILLTTVLIAAVMSLITVRPFVQRQEQLSREVEKKAGKTNSSPCRSSVPWWTPSTPRTYIPKITPPA